jgi:hypothetical protein
MMSPPENNGSESGNPPTFLDSAKDIETEDRFTGADRRTVNSSST